MVTTIVIKTKPIGVNRLYKGRRFLTKEGSAIKTAMAWEVKGQWMNRPYEGPLSVQVKFYNKDKKSLDIDGGLKGLFDCMTGLVWKDDRQIEEAHIFKLIDKENPRVEVRVLWHQEKKEM